MKQSTKRGTKGAKGPRPVAIPKTNGEPLFCRNCGEPSSQLDSFCPACGTVAEEE